MENTVKKTANEAVKSEVVKQPQIYVKVSEMTGNEINALPRANATLNKTKSKRGNVFYQLVVQLNPLLKITRTITENEFNLIVLERKLSMEQPTQHLIIPFRLLKGQTITDREWYRYEFFVSKNHRINDFFNQTETAIIKVGDLKLNFINSDEKYQDELVLNYNEEDFM